MVRLVFVGLDRLLGDFSRLVFEVQFLRVCGSIGSSCEWSVAMASHGIHEMSGLARAEEIVMSWSVFRPDLCDSATKEREERMGPADSSPGSRAQ
jgi:hypothetical protein